MSHQLLYSKLFSPPRFLERPSVAIQILTEGIYFMTTKNTAEGVFPDIYGFLNLPVGAVSKGEIISKEVVIKALVEIKKKTKVNFARFSIPDEQTYLFKTHLPKLKDKEIREVIDFKIEENIPLLAKEAVFDYEIIPKNKNGLDMIVLASSLKFIEETQQIFLSADLTPLLFSPEANNLAKSIIKASNEQIIVLVNFKENSTILSLIVSGIVYQTSSINFGSSTFTDLIAKYFKVSSVEAIKIKKEKLFTNNDLNMELFSYLINTISAIKDEIYKFVSYCNELEGISQVDRVVLSGAEALLVGLDEYLSSNLDIKVEVVNIWVNNFKLDTFIPNINKVDSLNWAVVNGLNLL
jgi:type IV pilus assembly protein PilM